MKANKAAIIAWISVSLVGGQALAQAPAGPSAATVPPPAAAPAAPAAPAEQPPAAPAAPAAPAPQPAAAPAPQPAAAPAPVAAPAQPEAQEPEEEKDPMSGIGVGLKFGYVTFGQGSFKKKIGGVTFGPFTVPSRSGPRISVPINLGSTIFGWIFELYLGVGDVGSIGLITGPTFTFQLKDMFYYGFGINFEGGYVTSSKYKGGFDSYLRIPITATYYVIEDLGIKAELALGYGVTGVQYKGEEGKVTVTDEWTGDVMSEDLGMGVGETYQIDFSFGVRWP